MVDPTSQNQPSSFLTSPEGKKILFFSLLLVVVVAMLVYAYYTREAATGNWQDLFQNASLNRQNLVRSEPYRRLLRDLRMMDARTYQQLRKREQSTEPDPAQLRQDREQYRGRIVSFQGRLTRSIPVELSRPGSPVTIRNLRVRNERHDLTYRVHLVRSPVTPLQPGSVVRGSGVYLLTAPGRQGNTGDDTSSPDVYLMARSVDVVRTNEPDTARDTKDENGDPDTSGSPPEDGKASGQIKPPKNYSNREQVTAYWHELLVKRNDRSMDFTDQLFKRMVAEVSKVGTNRLKHWVNKKLTANQLKPINDSSRHRGQVISFNGKYMQRYTRELLGGPQKEDVIWEYWIRNQKHHVTYTYFTLEKAQFEMSQGSAVQGTGVYLKTQLYDLLNPQGKRKHGRQILVLGPQLRPFFTPPDTAQTSSIRWFEYLLGGLIVFFFGLFLAMVYISMSREPEGSSDYVRDMRKRKMKHDADEQPDDPSAPDSS